MINILPQHTATISLILLKTVTFKISGFTQEIELKEGSKLIRTSENNSLVDPDTGDENKFINPETRIEYFDLYVKPSVDAPIMTNVEKMVIGDNETYNIRLTFKTQEAADELANHIEAIYQNKKAMFDLADSIPTILETCRLILGCTCEVTDEELDGLTAVEEEIEDYAEVKTI